mmetsp:Transcript_39436/g.85798  ORF Transcript_39436/g.85798 Transcript_39436/m.85798 type:complete len:207 (+) Transcript_39436:980-1600(+)
MTEYAASCLASSSLTAPTTSEMFCVGSTSNSTCTRFCGQRSKSGSTGSTSTGWRCGLVWCTGGGAAALKDASIVAICEVSVSCSWSRDISCAARFLISCIVFSLMPACLGAFSSEMYCVFISHVKSLATPAERDTMLAVGTRRPFTITPPTVLFSERSSASSSGSRRWRWWGTWYCCASSRSSGIPSSGSRRKSWLRMASRFAQLL